MSLFDLSGRRALVTGGSQGIGLALARGLAEAGASVLLNGRDAAKLAAAAAEIPGAGTTTCSPSLCLAIPCLTSLVGRPSVVDST